MKAHCGRDSAACCAALDWACALLLSPGSHQRAILQSLHASHSNTWQGSLRTNQRHAPSTLHHRRAVAATADPL